MKSVIVNLFIFFLLTGQSFVCAQQQFPVRTITNISAPYPVSLEQFTSVENGKISLTIIPNDVKLQNYPIKLKLVISGGWFTISSNPSFIHRNITINNGEIQTFSGAELAEWFNPDNLIFEGYSKSQYVSNGRLPEGMYQVWFEVYESNYGYNMSSSTKAMVWLFENDPPLLNFPNNAKEFVAVDPQNIVFNWTLRQSPFSTAGASNEFKFELWEIWPDNMNVEEVIRATRSVYSGSINTSTFTYSAAEPLLMPGRKYAWRIQAYDPEGKKRYKNDGYSEVRWFRFGKDCGVPVPILDKVTDNAIALKWENDYRFDKYELRWRFKDRQDAKWYTLDGDKQGALVAKLEPNTKYEMQVHGFCGIQEGEYSPSLTVRTKEETSCACGTPMGNIDVSSQEPLSLLKKGDFFRASDFDVQVYQVSGGNGTFTGKGFVSVPLLKSIKFEAEFKGVKINSGYRMYDGEVKFIYNQKNGISINVSQLLNALSPSAGDVNETNPYLDIADRKANVDTTISTITVRATGEIVVTKSDGRKEVIRAATGEMVAISGKSEGSEQYVVDTKTGTLYKAAPDKGSSGNAQPASGSSPAKYVVTFEPHSNQAYGMDKPGENTPVAVYNKNTIAGNEKDIAWKSVETGKIDRLLAKVEGGYVDSLHYITASNNIVMVAPGTEKNTSQLLVTGVEKTDELKAWYAEKINDSTENRILAAQLNLIAYDKQLINLCLVEINGAVAPNPDFVERELNSIYAPAVVQWKVKKIEGFKLNIEGLDNGKFVNKRTDGKMDYTDNEKQVRDAFMKTKDYDKSTVYLFFIGGNTTYDLKGFMPFNRQFGFIFTENTNVSDVIRTIAHEAGHGTFRLKHPYEATDPRMNTDNNLMAYSQSNRLYKPQWDECHDKDLGVNWFEDGEDGEIGWIPSTIVLDLPSINKNILTGNVLSSADKFNVGAYMPVNDDDDNDNGFSDNDISKDPGQIMGENDLYPIIIRGIEKENGYFTFNLSNGNIVVWRDLNRSALVNTPVTALTTDQIFYVEGLSQGSTEIELIWSRKNDRLVDPIRDRVRINIFQVTGPLSVPNYSIYEYGLKIQPAGGIFKCIEGNDPSYAIANTPSSMKIRWGMGPKLGIIQYTANDNFNWQFTINIVEVKIELVPGKVDFIRKGSGAGNPTFMRGGGIPIGPSNQRSFMFSSGAPTYPPGPNILAGQENIQSAIISEAKITLNGPNGRGQSQIEVGFIQNISFPRMEVSYVNTPVRIHANIESPDFIIDGDGANLPFYNITSSFRGTPGVNTGNIYMNDAPSASAPEYHPTNGNNWERFWWQEDFKLWISSRTHHRETNLNPNYTNLAEADWQFILDLERSKVISPVNLRSGNAHSPGDFLPDPNKNKVVLPINGNFTWKNDGSSPISSSNVNPANNTLSTLTY